jgi:hypothetical protein
MSRAVGLATLDHSARVEQYCPVVTIGRTRVLAPVVGAVGLLLATVATFVGAVVFDGLLRVTRPDLAQFDSSMVPFVLAAASAAGIGLVLGIHRPAHPAGWLLCGFALSIGLSALADGWSRYGAPDAAIGGGDGQSAARLPPA